jgi:primary-amine oxidase
MAPRTLNLSSAATHAPAGHHRPQDQSLEDADPVIWYAFGVTHVVRPEDFPVMPCEYVGFHLKPFGFFARNPALDISPEVNKASRKCCANGAVNGTTNGVTNGVANGAANGCH